jgi:hypothetical protein
LGRFGVGGSTAALSVQQQPRGTISTCYSVGIGYRKQGQQLEECNFSNFRSDNQINKTSFNSSQSGGPSGYIRTGCVREIKRVCFIFLKQLYRNGKAITVH